MVKRPDSPVIGTGQSGVSGEIPTEKMFFGLRSRKRPDRGADCPVLEGPDCPVC